MGDKNDEGIVRAMLIAIGDNPTREGLKDTPGRVVRSWSELFKGYTDDKPKITVFPNNADGIHYDQMILDSGYFWSFCEHHMLPFFGNYYFGYIPHEKVLGLSKVARVVDFHASRLQIQERLVRDIVNDIEHALTTKIPVYKQGTEEQIGFEVAGPKAIGLVLKGRHLCKEMRGVKKINGMMTTSDLRGQFRTEPETRAEFLKFINGN